MDSIVISHSFIKKVDVSLKGLNMSNISDEIKVSIECITYNHVNYIRDTLEGFLRQRTSFRFNVFIFDDCSTDGTSEIVREYAQKYPEIIHAQIAPHNTLSTGEWNTYVDKLKEEYILGKYCCWCEGDDYWTDPNKLQIQYDFMESHPDVSLTVHASEWLNCENGVSEDIHPYDNDGYISPHDVIMPPIGIFSFASVMAKKEVFFFDKAFPNADILDYPFQLYALTKGKVYYFDRVMSVYRYRHEGSWTEQTEKSQEKFLRHVFCIIDFLKNYDRYTDFEYSDAIIQRSNWWLCRSAFLNSAITWENFNAILDQVTSLGDSKYEYLKESMINAYRVLSGRFAMSEAEKKTLRSFSKVVVLGIGEYPKHVAANLDFNGISFDGYVELDHRKADALYDDKPVWHMSDYPFDWDKTFILVGGVWKLEKEVKAELERYSCKHFFAPLWYDYIGFKHEA